ncbi:MAG: glutaminase A [Sporomusaceae bacterium]|nr:glutaminase A [Sporomusaceae bacterium]
MQTVINRLLAKNRLSGVNGKVADYIPELAKVNPALLGAYVIDIRDGRGYASGDADAAFTIQSIAKVIAFACALLDNDLEQLAQTISVEPTADGFNSIASLETRNTHKPLNPMINAGAIATIPFVRGASYAEKFERILALMQTMAGNPGLSVNHRVYRSESLTGNRNRALAYYMYSTGIIKEDIEDLLDVYFRLCSVSVTCKDLAAIGGVLANHGLNPQSGIRLLSKDNCRIVKAVMATCGLYNESGLFAATVGIPAKSGVGGGILAVVPGQLGIGVFSPLLDDKGNSIAGMSFLADLSRELDLSIY